MRKALSVFILSILAFTVKAQQYEMVFAEYDFGTMYLDYPVTIPTGSAGVRGVYYVSSIIDGDVKLKRIKGNIPAQTAVMVQGNPYHTYTFYKTNTNVNPISNNLLRGSLVDISVADALAEAGASDKALVMTYGMPNEVGFMGFYRYTGKTLKANKAFLIYDPDNGGYINSLTITVEDDDLDFINIVDEPEGHETWHTLQGVRLNDAPTHPGVFIRNGKAVVVK